MGTVPPPITSFPIFLGGWRRGTMGIRSSDGLQICFVSLSRTCRWGTEGLGIFVASRSTGVQSVAGLAIGEHGP